MSLETATKTGMILVFGEISTSANIDFQAVVRKKIREIGYTDSKLGTIIIITVQIGINAFFFSFLLS